ncbi:MAG: hypothetical protein RJA70_1788 [Pseudomonadota bacterium]
MPKLFDHPYAEFLDRVEKPTRYTGREHGSRVKDWYGVDCRMCLAFPDIYDIGMSHLGYRMLYRILNDNERILAERCYTPWQDMVGELKANGEFVRSLENRRPLCDFDVVGFSLQYELTFTNILLMLDLGGIPLRSEHRGDHDPLVIAGGPVATHAEPMAIFFDAIAIGDGEELTTEVALLWADLKKQGIPRRERLERLAQISGVYVPSLYETTIDEVAGFQVVTGTNSPYAPLPVERRLLPDINTFPFPDDGPVGGPEAIFDRMSIEVARGCTEGCRFCQAGMIYRPVRERNPEEIIATVERAIAKSGHDEVSLAALSTADVSCISPLIKKLVEKTAPERVSLSVASLRAYGLADDLLDDMRKVRAAGLTFAPEAGTQRMRDVINKNVTEAQLMDTAERVFSRGFDKMKLYFMIGLPTETDEDVEGIVDVGKHALAVGQRLRRGRAKVTVSVSTHVPKPHTPFQWCAMDSMDSIARKQNILRDAARGRNNVNLKTHDASTTVLEGVLARGDRRLGPAIERAFQNGAYFDSWEELLRLDLWQEAFDHFEIQQAQYLGTIPVDARLPWDHFDIGLEEGFLLREYRKALNNRLSPPCGKAKGMFIHHTNTQEASADDRRLVCYDCGIACDMSQMREERIVQLTQMGATEPGQRARLPLLPMPTQAGKTKGDPEQYRPPRPGGEPRRFRLRFEKTRAMAMLGHLDLLRELPRVIRRADVRTHYTQGFHPKPDISFGPALSLGVASLDEYVDIKLIDAPDADELKTRLNQQSPEGLSFTGVRALDPHEPRVNALITGARYLIVFATSALKALGGRANVEREIERFLASDERLVMRRVKGLGKKMNVRDYVTRLRLCENADAARQAGLVGDLCALEAEVRITALGSIKTHEIVDALFLCGSSYPVAPVAPSDTIPHRAVRLSMLSDMSPSGSPFDRTPAPEPFRKPAAEPAAAPAG